jgi:flagellar biosynthesis/type III secretory pathway chaperone
MEPEDILGKLERALEDERVAIRGLNGPQVEACAARKTALVGELMQIDARRRAPLAKRLKALVDQLRLNASSATSCA